MSNSSTWDARHISNEHLQNAIFKECDLLKNGDEVLMILNTRPDSFVESIRQKHTEYSFDVWPMQNNEWNLRVKRATKDEVQNRGCCGVCGG